MQNIKAMTPYQGGSNEKMLVGPSLSIDDVIRAMTSLSPPSLQNIGGAAAPVAPPVATPPASTHNVKFEFGGAFFIA